MIDRRRFDLCARTDINLLITGPTGVGKTYLARQIHEKSARRNGPFVVVNLATLHEGTLESELFGHDRGAYTDAHKTRVGRLEEADGGTVLLDEIGELSPRLQSRLLEFLQEKTITRMGSNRVRAVDLRVIAATNRNLREEVLEKKFRADLFYRLNGIPIVISPIAGNKRLILEMAEGFLKGYCRVYGNEKSFSPQILERVISYSWPGNLRQLKNAVELLFQISEGSKILEKDFSIAVSDSQEEASESIAFRGRRYKEARASFERAFLGQAVRSNGSLAEAARSVGMSKSTFARKVRNYGLSPDP